VTAAPRAVTLDDAPHPAVPPHAGDSAAGATTAVLELRIGELRQLFNAMDPAPFRERDLDPNAETYIVEWARETRPGQALRLVVHLGREAAPAGHETMLRDAVDGYFRQRARSTWKELRQLFRVGRVSLLIGLAFLAGAIVVGEFVASLVDQASYSGIIKESFVIGGWVALWRPLEIFLYDWWPIRAQARLFERLGEMDVHVLGASPAGAARAAAP
jgi:hypothetical protein